MCYKKLIIFVFTLIVIISCAFSNIHILNYEDENYIGIENEEIDNNTLKINNELFSNEINNSIEQIFENDGEEKQFEEITRNELRKLFGFKWNNENHFNGNLAETPEYMIELYKLVNNKNALPGSTYPYNSFAIRSYMELNTSFARTHFVFGISSNELEYLKTANILEAELRIYRLWVNLEDETFAPLITPPYFLLKVYQVTDIEHLETPDIQILLNVHYVSYFNFGWQIFNIKSALQSWISGDKPNLGLLIIATTLFGDNLCVEFSRRDFQENVLQPIVIVYEGKTKDLSSQNLKSDENVYSSINNYSKIKIDTTTLPCQRNDFYINFTTLGWSDFILEPIAYNAYRCTGNCKYSLNFKWTNYAAIKTLLYELKMDNVTNSCCVPNALMPLNILYYSDLNTIILKRYDQMIIEDCTCK